MALKLVIITAAQKGANRSALDWAIKSELPHGGWCPLGGLKDEDTVLEVARVAYVEGMEQEAITTEPDLLPEPGTDLPPPEAGAAEADAAEAE